MEAIKSKTMKIIYKLLSEVRTYITYETLTTVEQFFIRLILTVRCAITGELIVNTLSVSTLKL